MLCLDVGCGHKPSGDVNIDRDNSFKIEWSKIPCKGHFIIADAKRLPLQNSVFDKIFTAHVIEHFPMQEASKLLSEWFRVLKTGGTFELICPNIRSLRTITNYIIKSEFPQTLVYASGEHKAAYTPKTIARLIKAKTSSLKYVHRNPPPPHYVWTPKTKLEKLLVYFFPTLAGDIHILATKR